MKNIIRNLFLTLTKFKMASILNILGLTIAFAVFMVIMTQIMWERGYNKSFKKGEDTYMLAVEYYDRYSTHLSRPLAEQVGQSSPLIEEYTPYWDYNSNIYVINNIETYLPTVYVGSNFAEMFSFKTVEGNLSKINEPNSVIIPKSWADKYFRGESAIGKTLTRKDDDQVDVIVGVYEDLPENSMFGNAIYSDLGDYNIETRSEWSYQYFYKFIDGTSPEKVIESLIAELSKDMPDDSEGLEKDFFRFESIDEFYFSDIPTYFEKGNKPLSIILFSVAMIIILIALINYINFFMALVPIRIRSVNISKVFGASLLSLKANIMFEAIGIVLLSFLLSLPLVQYISTLEIGEFTSVSLAITDNIPMVIFTFLLAIGVALITGLFPAYYITKFSPALILKGSFGRSKSGRKFRAILSAFQFVISMSLTIIALFVLVQNKYLKSYDYGFERENMLTTRLNGEVMQSKDVFSSELRRNTDIIDIAYSDNSIFNFGMGWGRDINGEEVNFSCLPTSWNFPEFLGLELVDGRFFIEEDKTKPGGTAIFNETAAKLYKLKVGDKFYGHANDLAEVVGIVKDFNFRSLHQEIKPVCLYEFGSAGWRDPSMLNIKYRQGADLGKVREFIVNTILEISPNTNPENIEITHLNQDLDAIYKKEDKLSQVISVFSIVSILISLLGLFGIIVFETQYRRKEVAIRKVHGSSIQEILFLFNSQIVRVLCISAIISIPISWFIVKGWLSSFAYKVPLYWWVFASAIAIVSIIVISVVTAQTFKSAKDNPVGGLGDN